MLAKRIKSLENQIDLGQCNGSRLYNPRGTILQSLNRTQEGSGHTCQVRVASQAEKSEFDALYDNGPTSMPIDGRADQTNEQKETKN